MARTQTLGTDAERLAADYLRRQGLHLIECNYRCRGGELDLIMQAGLTRVFVEVRYRSGNDFGGALASIDARKRHRLIHAARHYLQSSAWAGPCRFDAIGVDGAGQCEWVVDAFAGE